MSVRVSQLMSRGRVQTLDASARLADVARRAHRIGHSCWPVLDEGRLVGMLSQRDLERALEHDLGSLTVRDVMVTDLPVLRENDDLSQLPALLARRGRQALAVVDADGQLTGVLSRGDLLRNQAGAGVGDVELSLDEFPHRELVLRIGDLARECDVALWLVGGTVRDMLLGRPCDDLDFVVEGSPRRLAALLRERLGGQPGPQSPFGTLRWLPDERLAEALAIPLEQMPGHVDLARARAETYAHPAALPCVTPGSLLQDLGRRDFSCNALALQVAPVTGRLTDPCGGLADLKAGLLRVLHSLSFHDDPLRILRAWRFRARLGFDIEARTVDLMQVARPALGRITGTRLRNELELILQEEDPGGILSDMQSAGLLRAMHPAFSVPANVGDRLARARDSMGPPDPPSLMERLWHAIAAGIEPDELPAWAERLQFAPRLSRSMQCACRLLREPGPLERPSADSLQIVNCLLPLPRAAVWCAWQLGDDALVRERLAGWLTRWPATRPLITGHDLLAAGLSPGPAFARILLRLRVAWYDGSVSSAAEESDLLARLVADERHAAEAADAD